jgi:hypothetical protein
MLVCAMPNFLDDCERSGNSIFVIGTCVEFVS